VDSATLPPLLGVPACSRNRRVCKYTN